MGEHWFDLYLDTADELSELEGKFSILEGNYKELVKQVENLPEDIYNKYIAEIE